MKRTFIYIVVILGAFCSRVQCLLFALADIVPNLLIIVTASIALIGGQSEGCSGRLCGLLMDISVGYYLGINALCFLVIGFVLGYLNQIYYEEGYYPPLY